MGVIDTLKDFAGDVADDTKEAFDELLDRDDCWDDPWDGNRRDPRRSPRGRAIRDSATRYGGTRDYDTRAPEERGSRSRAGRNGYYDFYYYCECSCHYHEDPYHQDPYPDRAHRRSPASRVAREVAPASPTTSSALPEGASRAEQPERADSADTARLSAQINDLAESINALRKNVEQLPRATAPQNGAST